MFTGAGHGGCGGGGEGCVAIYGHVREGPKAMFTLWHRHTHMWPSQLDAICIHIGNMGCLYLSIFILMLRHICPGVTNCRHDQLLVHPTRDIQRSEKDWQNVVFIESYKMFIISAIAGRSRDHLLVMAIGQTLHRTGFIGDIQ